MIDAGVSGGLASPKKVMVVPSYTSGVLRVESFFEPVEGWFLNLLRVGYTEAITTYSTPIGARPVASSSACNATLRMQYTIGSLNLRSCLKTHVTVQKHRFTTSLTTPS